MQQVEVKLFAIARERVGGERVVVSLPRGANVSDLRRALAEQYPPLADILESIRFAVNNDYATDDVPLPLAAEVACIPPVSGG